jgi:TPP-dependent pyruvate/acetoin dehydrogenase alpha subunit
MFLRKQGIRDFDEEEDKKFRKQVRDEVSKCLKDATNAKLVAWKELFTDVYDKMPENLIE